MAGKPNGRGGLRPGAGRKPKATPAEIKQEENQTAAAPSRRGGARAGAGRKPKPAEVDTPLASAVKERLEPQPHGGSLKRSKSEPVPIGDRDMLQLLQDIAFGRVEATMLQVRAAIAAVQYTHAKMGEGGKKDAKAEAAKKAASKFGALAPPKLVVSNGK